MCLGVPGKIVSIDDLVGVVDFWGVKRTVALQIVDEPVAVGDYVLVHVGFAIRRIPEEEIESTLAFFEDMASEDLEGLSPRKPAPNPEGA
ncbi:MAG: HypC/HybG/HupF family hydrogenase formation chaperone [Myxococcales bacterium]|nr:HypC/HybG/HupF family hydrogenase formation chaperone [Myxococcales bacterium]